MNIGIFQQSNFSEMKEDQKWGVPGMPGEARRIRGEQQQPLWRHWRDLCSATICTAVALLCIGFCVVVFVRTSELQSRILSLEQQQQQRDAWMLSVEQVEPVILGRLDQILEEVSAS